MNLRTRIFGCLLSIFFGPVFMVKAEKVGDRYSWPPVLERLVGNPEIVILVGENRVGEIEFSRSQGKLYLNTCRKIERSEVDKMVCDHFFGMVWNYYLSTESKTKAEVKFRMREFIPLSRADFFRIGRCRLLGHSTGSKTEDAWWNVRMGEKLEICPNYLLMINSLKWSEKDFINHGHFSFGIRKRGGSVDSDIIFDFRAPWNSDQRTKLKDAFGEPLFLHSYRENYYDWLSTQTALRHCDVTSTFVSVHQEQIILIQSCRERIHDVVEYNLLKGNCATIGVQFLNRLLPLDQRIPCEFSLIDLPARKIRLAAKSFGKFVAVVEHKSSTLSSGRSLTHKNQTMPAVPGRKSCLPFQKLLQVAAVN